MRAAGQRAGRNAREYHRMPVWFRLLTGMYARKPRNKDKMQIATERVITEVHQRPLLWDKKHENYKNRGARDVAWKKILKSLVPDYKSMSAEQRKEADKKIQQRWRTARDTYQKEKLLDKNQSASGISRKKQKYSYFELLTFLDSSRPTEVDESVNESLSEESCSDNPDVDIPVKTPPPLPSAPATSQPPLPTQGRTKLIKKKFRSHQSDLQADDLAFFQSLQPSLRNFNRYQKLMFRTRVLNVIMEMEKQSQYPAYSDPIASTSNSAFTNYDMSSLSPLHYADSLNAAACDRDIVFAAVTNNASSDGTGNEQHDCHEIFTVKQE